MSVATKQRPVKKAQRDPNVPVLAFKIGTTLYEILIAGPKDYIQCAYNPKHSWSPNSLIVRRFAQGVTETEYDLHDAGTWGWIGRLMADPTGNIGTIEQLTSTDVQMLHGESFEYKRPESL